MLLLLFAVALCYGLDLNQRITVNVERGDLLGISVKENWEIDEIEVDSIFKRKGVFPGDKIISINKKYFDKIGSSEAKELLARYFIPRQIEIELNFSSESRKVVSELIDNHTHTGPHIDVFGEVKFISTFAIKPALFGSMALCSKLPLTLADPLDSCLDLQNGNNIKNKYVLVSRGGCTFPEKAYQIQEGGGVGMIVINDNDQIISMPGSEKVRENGGGGEHIFITVAMISQYNGQELTRMVESAPKNNNIYAKIVSSDDCFHQEGLFHSETDISEIIRNNHNVKRTLLTQAPQFQEMKSGQLQIIARFDEVPTSYSFDFVTAPFTYELPLFNVSNNINNNLLYIKENSDEWCNIDERENNKSKLNGKYKNSYVLVEKSHDCSLFTLSRNLKYSGNALGVIIINNDNGLNNIIDRSKEDKTYQIDSTNIEAVIITLTAGERIKRILDLRKNSNVTLRFINNDEVFHNWGEIDKLKNISSWPKVLKDRKKVLNRLKKLYSSEEKLVYLNDIYNEIEKDFQIKEEHVKEEL